VVSLDPLEFTEFGIQYSTNAVSAYTVSSPGKIVRSPVLGAVENLSLSPG